MARPRDESVDERVISAARTLLRETGYAGFAVDEVAAQAGVARTTLYRRWPTRDHLVVAAFGAMFDDAPIAEVGDVRVDLTRTVTAIATGLQQPAMRALVAEMIAAGTRHNDLGDSLRQLWARRRATASDVIRRGIARGELQAHADPALIIDQLAGPLYYRILITGDAVTDSYLTALVDAALSSVTPKSGGTR